MPDKILLPKQDKSETQNIPRVTERFYNEKGKLIGMAILVQEGKLPLTGKQFAQWCQEKYPQREEES